MRAALVLALAAACGGRPAAVGPGVAHPTAGWVAGVCAEARYAPVARRVQVPPATLLSRLAEPGERRFRAGDVAGARQALTAAAADRSLALAPADHAQLMGELALVTAASGDRRGAERLMEPVLAGPLPPLIELELLALEDTFQRQAALAGGALDPPERQQAIQTRMTALANGLGYVSSGYALDPAQVRSWPSFFGHPGQDYIGPLAGALGLLDEARRDRDNPERAFAATERAWKIADAILPEGDPQRFEVAHAYAIRSLDRGDLAHGCPVYREAAAIAEHAPHAVRFASSLPLDLAEVSMARGEYAAAGQLLDFSARLLGPHPDPDQAAHIIDVRIDLAMLTGDNAAAETWLRAKLAAIPPGTPPYEALFETNQLAKVLHLRGADREADQLLATAAKQGGELQAEEVAERAGVAEALGDATRARTLLADALRTAETELAQALTGKGWGHGDTNNEEDLYRRVAASSYLLDRAVSQAVGVGHYDPLTATMAFEALLRQKGRALDSAGLAMRALRHHLDPTSRPRFDQLLADRDQLSRLLLQAPSRAGQLAFQRELEQLQQAIEQLEVELGDVVARFRTRQIDLATITAALPAGTVLVDLVSYRPYQAHATRLDAEWRPAHYAACVVSAAGPRWVDLGDALTIDAAIREFRATLADPRRSDVGTLGRKVDALVWERFEPLVGAADTVLVSPDATLNLLPMAALVAPSGHYRGQDRVISYLSSARDLAPAAATAASSPPAIFANPAYGERPTGPVAAVAKHGVDLLHQAFWPALPHTGEEATQIQPYLAGAITWSAAAATEQALKALHGPSVLHIATHGYFLPDDAAARAAPAARGLVLETAPAPSFATQGNPLTRSGLALAGANHGGDGHDDGILTALEASSLDLEGTQLVVLSACETGVGELRNGDGVYGLRRALVLAGAESQVMTLWSVDDDATRQLMVDYYQALEGQRGRAAALLDAQRQFMGKRHPYYWAAFIESGQSGPLRHDVAPAPAAAPGVDPDDVPMAGGNPQRTGVQHGTANRTLARELWSVKVGVGTDPVVANGMVLVGNNRLRALWAATGKPVWQFEAGAPVSTPTVWDGVVYLSGWSGELVALDVQTGSVRWRSKLGAMAPLSPIVHEHVVYAGAGPSFGDPTGHLFALDVADGKQRWSIALPGGTPMASALDGGVLYIGTWVGFPDKAKPPPMGVSALDAATGRLLWSTPVGAVHRITVADGVVVAATEKDVVALDAKTGTQRWSSRHESVTDEVLSLNLQGGVAYIGWRYRELRALELASGAEKWRKKVELTGSPDDVGGVLYFGERNQLSALELATGKEWHRAAGSDGYVDGPSLAAGVVFYNDGNGTLHAVR